MGAGAPKLIAHLRAFLDGTTGPPAGSHGLVAVSGGPDSTALALALAELASERDLRLTLAHVQHALRGAASDRDEAFVRRLGEQLALELQVRPAIVPAGGNLEARAREARYRALATIARDVAADWIATGHTVDDQVETLLLRLLRGGGRGAIAGMRPARGRLLRPLLAASRADVRWYLAERRVVVAADTSNADLRFTRNRVRHLLVPLLEREFAPRLRERVGALAARLRDEDDHLEMQARERAEALGVGARLPRTVAAEPTALGRRIVRRWLESGRRRGVTSRHVEAVLRLAGQGHARSVAVPGPGRVVRVGDELKWEAGRQEAQPAPFRLPLEPGRCAEGAPDAGWTIHLSMPEPHGGAMARPTLERAVFDADRLPVALDVRSIRAGDRIHLPAVGTKKLQDLLVDRKVPRSLRRRLPVLATEDSVVWVPGIARSSVAWVGSETTRVVWATASGLEVFGLPVKNHCGSLARGTRAFRPRRL